MREPKERRETGEKPSVLNRQKRLILLALAASLVLAIGLFAAYQTVWKPSEEQTDAVEYLTNASATLSTDLSMEQISEISVKSRENAFRLYRGGDGELYFEGAERVLYNTNRIAFLRSCVTNLAVSAKVENPGEMSEYALTDETCLASFSVTSTEGASYRILIGNKLVGGAGYYARVADDPLVWVLPTSLETCLFGGLDFFLLGQVAPSLSESNYFEISNFKIEKNLARNEEGEYVGDVVVEVEKIPEDQIKENDVSTHRIIAPVKDAPNTELLTLVFKSFVSFVGEDVAEYDMSEKSAEEFSEIMERYGFLAADRDAMHCRVSYTHSGVETLLYVSRPNAEGVTYVYSPGFEVVVAFDSADLAWCEYSLMEYAQPELFLHSIAEVKTLSVSAAGIETVFTLTHGENAEDLRVNSSTGPVNVQDFRRFYNQILFLEKVEEYQPEAGFEEKRSLSLTFEMKGGETYTYTFYDVKTLRSYFLLNGEGGFCIKRDYVQKLCEDTAKLLAGQTVTAVQYP